MIYVILKDYAVHQHAEKVIILSNDRNSNDEIVSENPELRIRIMDSHSNLKL